MKKLFISVPMRGRTEENIRASIEKMHKMAEIIFGDPPKNSNEAIWYLGKTIQLMSEADYFIGIYSYLCGMVYSGCEIESSVASNYEIPYVLVDDLEAHYIMPDLYEQKEVMMD